MRMSNLNFTNGTDVYIDLEQFILTGCWYDTEHCIRQKCYKKKKCDCQQDQFCSWNSALSKHECTQNAACTACKTEGKWCKRDIFDGSYFYLCLAEPEESLAPSDNCNPACGTNEICVNGYCDYKGHPCYYDSDNSFLGVFCSKDQECVNSVCYDKCSPDCYKDEDCLFDSALKKFKCVQKDKTTKLTVISDCSEISHCGSSNQLGICEKCQTNYSFLGSASSVTYN